MTGFTTEGRRPLGLIVGALLVGFAHWPTVGWATNPLLAEQAVPAQASPGGKAEEPGPKPESQASDLASMTVELVSRPVALAGGKSDWSKGLPTIMEKITEVDRAIAAAGLVRTGRPFAVFLATDEESFQFEAMIPIAEKPAGKTSLTESVKLGSSPAGKAIKFQHRGPYDDIESTYALITAFLDEKGLEAQNLFIEEYLTDTKEPDDVTLEADIYVFVK